MKEEENSQTQASIQLNEQQQESAETLSHQRMALSSRRTLSSSMLSLVVGFPGIRKPANAYERAYPLELNSIDAIGAGDGRSRKINEVLYSQNERSIQTGALTKNKLFSSILWGCALWFWSGSRSNPIATPLANFVYKREDEQWLQDRNDGWFAALPWEFLLILAGVFLAGGYLLDCIIIFISSDFSINESILDSTTTLSLQLATVLLIAGGSFELGRIFSGEKQSTKEEGERSMQLQTEFEAFADNRLIVVGRNTSKYSAHRSEIVSAFRRYYSKYRIRPEDSTINGSSDSQNAVAVSDLEIERLLREWARSKPFVDMTSAGFYNGIQINKDADVFASR